MKNKKLIGICFVIACYGAMCTASSSEPIVQQVSSPDDKLGIAIANDNMEQVRKLVKNDKLTFDLLKIHLMNAAMTGKQEIVKELFAYRNDQIDPEDVSNILLQVVSRHNDRIYKQMLIASKEELTNNHVKIMQIMLDKKGTQIPSDELRDVYTQAMKINDNSRGPIVKVLTDKMRKLGIEWN